MPPTNRSRGQALPLALAGLFCAALLFGFMLRSGQRLIERERLRARTDVTAFSAGISYARGLNLLAASQKTVAFGWAISVFDGAKTKKFVQDLQAKFLKAGPWLSAGMTLNVGLENGLAALPVWNQDVLFDGLSKDALYPSYNVEPYTVSNAFNDTVMKAMDLLLPGRSKAPELRAALDKSYRDLKKEHGDEAAEDAAAMIKEHLPGWEPEGLFKTGHYEYERKDGTKVRVEADEAGEVWENGPGGKKVRRHKASKKHKYRYVKAVPAVDEGFQLSLHDGHPHMVTLVTLPLQARHGKVLSISQVQVAGGSQSLMDPEGSSYNATLVPVQLFPEDGWKLEGLAALMGAGAMGRDLDMDAELKLHARFDLSHALSAAQGLREALPLSEGLGRRADFVLGLARELDRVQH